MMTSPMAAALTNRRLNSDYYVEGYATTFDDPYLLYEWDGVKFYERIAPDALAGADMSDVIMQYDHRGKVLARMSNGTLGIEPDGRGLFVFADLSKSRAAQELFEEIQNELVTRMSWAFTVAEESYEQGTRTRTILRVKKVYDVSAVSIPANDGTEIMARSFAQGRLAAERQELLKRRIQLLNLRIRLEESK